MKTLLAAIGILLAGACAESPPAAVVSSASPSAGVATATAEPAPSPLPSPLAAYSPTPLPVGTPVASRVLPPATVPPVARLCTTRTIYTADGNVQPALCRGGAVNVLAWRFYATVSPTMLAAGRGATRADVEAAVCRDAKTIRVTQPELDWCFVVAATYYGWSFSFDPRNMTCQ